MHRAKGDRFVRASELPVCDNAISLIRKKKDGHQGEWLIMIKKPRRSSPLKPTVRIQINLVEVITG